MLQKMPMAFWVDQNAWLYTKWLPSDPPKIINLCYTKYRRHFGRLKRMAFLPSGCRPTAKQSLFYVTKIINSILVD
jgi:hypothetical protein